ncbi:MAG: TolC family protein [Clostridiales bacterium]|jgi:outer membrane protein TolC|nr:TolC family protein [Clostridiales bacterium]
MKKRWIVIALLGAILLTAAAGFVVANERLTLRGAVEQAVMKNPRMKLAEYGTRKSNLNYDMTEKIADVYRRLLNTVKPVEGEDAMFRFVFIDTVKAESDKAIAEKQEEITRHQLAFDAQESYLRLIKAREQKAIMERSLDRAKDLKRLADVAYQTGTVSRSEVMRAEAYVATMEAANFQLESAVTISEATLNMTMGRELTDSVYLDESFTLPDVGGFDLASGISRALNNNIDLMKARSGVTIADAALAYTKFKFGTSDEAYEIAEISKEEAKLYVKLAEDRVRLEVFALYQQLAGKEKQLTALQKSVNLAAENYRLSVLRYELGVATQGEVIDTMLGLSEQEAKLVNEQFDYYLDYLNWRLKTGLTVN